MPELRELTLRMKSIATSENRRRTSNMTLWASFSWMN